MNGGLTDDERDRLHTIICGAHSEVCCVIGMTVPQVLEWLTRHTDCDVTVILADEPTLIRNTD